MAGITTVCRIFAIKEAFPIQSSVPQPLCPPNSLSLNTEILFEIPSDCRMFANSTLISFQMFDQ